jgi:DNA polymerase I-like protein with 3'-5' exonuclease and polymerase domains
LKGSFRVTWPQQIEADLIKTAVVPLDRILRRGNMNAHIVRQSTMPCGVETPEEEADQVRHLVRLMMTTAVRLGVPLEGDIK